MSEYTPFRTLSILNNLTVSFLQGRDFHPGYNFGKFIETLCLGPPVCQQGIYNSYFTGLLEHIWNYVYEELCDLGSIIQNCDY